MNTKKILFGILACVTFMAVSCESSTAEDDLYENGVNKTQLINGDKRSVNKTQLINGDRRSVDKTQLVNGDSRR